MRTSVTQGKFLVVQMVIEGVLEVKASGVSFIPTLCDPSVPFGPRVTFQSSYDQIRPKWILSNHACVVYVLCNFNSFTNHTASDSNKVPPGGNFFLRHAKRNSRSYALKNFPSWVTFQTRPFYCELTIFLLILLSLTVGRFLLMKNLMRDKWDIFYWETARLSWIFSSVQ